MPLAFDIYFRRKRHKIAATWS